MRSPCPFLNTLANHVSLSMLCFTSFYAQHLSILGLYVRKYRYHKILDPAQMTHWSDNTVDVMVDISLCGAPRKQSWSVITSRSLSHFSSLRLEYTPRSSLMLIPFGSILESSKFTTPYPSNMTPVSVEFFFSPQPGLPRNLLLNIIFRSCRYQDG